MLTSGQLNSPLSLWLCCKPKFIPNKSCWRMSPWGTAQPVLCPAAGSCGQAESWGGRIFQSSPPCAPGHRLQRRWVTGWPFALPSQASPPQYLMGAELPWNLAPLCRGGKCLAQPPHEAQGGQGTCPRSWQSQVVNSHLWKCVLFFPQSVS